MLGLLKGMQATISHLLTRKVTVQYPEERRRLPERSRGLIRLRLKPDAVEPRCISCTFCEQVCPSVAIRIIYKNRQPEKVWSLDAGAGPMLFHVARKGFEITPVGFPGVQAGTPFDPQIPIKLFNALAQRDHGPILARREQGVQEGPAGARTGKKPGQTVAEV